MKERKKTYKDFEKTYIGSSDIAALTLTGMGEDGVKAEILRFGGDNSYHAYIITEDDVEIPQHYELNHEFRTWMTIFDDHEKTFKIRSKEIKVYRAGTYGCIIHAPQQDEEF